MENYSVQKWVLNCTSRIITLALEKINMSITTCEAFLPFEDWSGEAAQNSEDSETRFSVFVLHSFILHFFIQLSLPECLSCATLSDPVDIIVNKVGTTPTIMDLPAYVEYNISKYIIIYTELYHHKPKSGSKTKFCGVLQIP